MQGAFWAPGGSTQGPLVGPPEGILLTKVLPKRPINLTVILRCIGWAAWSVTVWAARMALRAPSQHFHLRNYKSMTCKPRNLALV